ncbi:MAG: FAD-dependent monooxygenase [Hyphomicrobiaceae bacterium]|nr:FAD-dependent monooxygenase [Hyphomicrobiaceae bacterium]
MIKTPILIIGAGPTGLMLSAQLHRYGAPHVIVDLKDGITELSKALGVQARTLEQYRQLGIADAALSEGFIARNVRFVVKGRTRAQIQFGEIGGDLSPYPYLFILEQSRNEALLHDYISARGGKVQWSSEVVDLKKHDAGYTGTIRRGDGREEAFECRYLIGCGGAHSAVRHLLEMPFKGETNEQLFFVADMNIELEMEKQGLLLAINKKEFLAFFPMSGENQYRVIGILPPTVEDPHDFPFEVLKTHVDEVLDIPAQITGHSWYSGYRVHHRIVDTFRNGNAFLAGDAAHIHSPAGGQGMNTGLGDAVNLGWKLAAVVNGWYDEKILDSYNEERRPFGVQLVRTTDQAFTVIVSPSTTARLFRTYLLPVILSVMLKFEPLRRFMFKTISQTRITYRGSSLTDGSRSGTLHSGDRFPWFEWEGGNSFDWLSDSGYVVLRFGEAGGMEIPDWSGPVVQIAVAGAAADAAERAGFPRNGVVIVRPDMHIAKLIAG